MTVSVSDKNARMEVEFPPDWRVLRDLRSFVKKLVVSVAESDDLAARVSMVVTELAENAVKYADESSTIVRLRVEPTSTGIRCESENKAKAEHIDQLKKTLANVSTGDAFSAYERALVSSAEQGGTTSQIGLARIRLEGQMELRCVVVDQHVRIIAEMPRVAA